MNVLKGHHFEELLLLDRAMIGHFKHIIWDWNGTLLDDVELSLDIMNKQIGKYGLPSVSVEEHREKFVFPIVNYYLALGFDPARIPSSGIHPKWREEYEQRLGEARLHPRSEELLKHFFDRGTGQSILSAHGESELLNALRFFGVDRYFFRMFGLDNPGCSKVLRGRELVAELSCRPEECVLIGDSLHDHEVAAELGFGCLLMAHGHCSRQRLEKTGQVVVESFEELFQALLAKSP